MSGASREKGVLNGIRLLDLANEEGSFCSKLLADFGALVIKVEKPGGDPSRKIGPFGGKSPILAQSFFFAYHNSNKLGITLDLEKEEGRRIFGQLIRKVDVVVETFSPDYLEKLSLGFDALTKINPRLILASITGFGQSGPRRNYKSCDLVAAATGGQMAVSGLPALPLKPFGEQSYYTASLYGAIGILLAWRKRAQTGKGAHLDISLQEAAASTLGQVMARYRYERIIPQRQESLRGDGTFHILPCRDGHILLSPFHHWETLVGWMDSEGMAEDLQDEKYASEESRRNHIDHIRNVLQRWTQTHTAEELFLQGQLRQFPWAPIHSPRQVAESQQLKARNFFTPVHHPEMGVSLSYPGMPYKNLFGGQWKRAPLLGEDNQKVYQETLGLSAEEMKRLANLGVI